MRTISWKNAEENFYINSFGEDEEGELYLLSQKGMGPGKAGRLYKIHFD
jgi:hypothetical protein